MATTTKIIPHPSTRAWAISRLGVAHATIDREMVKPSRNSSAIQSSARMIMELAGTQVGDAETDGDLAGLPSGVPPPPDLEKGTDQEWAAWQALRDAAIKGAP